MHTHDFFIFFSTLEFMVGWELLFGFFFFYRGRGRVFVSLLDKFL